MGDDYIKKVYYLLLFLVCFINNNVYAVNEAHFGIKTIDIILAVSISFIVIIIGIINYRKQVKLKKIVKN